MTHRDTEINKSKVATYLQMCMSSIHSCETSSAALPPWRCPNLPSWHTQWYCFSVCHITLYTEVGIFARKASVKLQLLLLHAPIYVAMHANTKDPPNPFLWLLMKFTYCFLLHVGDCEVYGLCSHGTSCKWGSQEKEEFWSLPGSHHSSE